MAKKLTKVFFIGAASLWLAACESPEEKVERYYESGVEFLEKGDRGRANVQFQNVLKINDQHVPTLSSLAKIAEDKKDFEAMFAVLQRVVRLDPDNVDALAKLGKLYLIGGEDTEALELADRALALQPENHDALTLKASVLLRIGDTNGAVEIAEEVKQADPSNAEAATIIATARATSGDIDGALAELDRVLEIDPKRAVIQLLRVRLLAQQGREEDVMSNLQNLTVLFPEEPAYFRTYSLALIEREEYANAVQQLEKVVELRPNELDAKLDVIRVLRTAEGNDAGERRLKEFVAAQPENADLKFALVDYLIQEEKTDEALGVLAPMAAAGDSSYAPKARNRIAAIYLRNGDRAEAEKLVDAVLEEDPGNNTALMRRAQFQILDNELDTAIANLRTVLNNDPESYEAMVLMASAFEKQGNLDVARAELAKGFEASNGNSRIANLLARFLLRENNPSRAASVLEESLGRYPDDEANLKLLAQARLRNEDWRGAEEVAGVLENLNDAGSDDAAMRIRSVALSGLEEYDQVIEMLSQEGEDQPLATTPLALLIQAYLAQDKYDEAQATLSGVIEADPENYAARMILARTYSAQNNQAAFEQTLLDAIEASPSQADAYTILYRSYVLRGETAKAEAIIDRGVAGAPDSDSIKIYKADTLLIQGRDTDALALYDDLLESVPDNRVVVNNYISLVSRLRPDENSVREAMQYVETIANEDNPYFQDTVGWGYYRMGDYERALEYLEKASTGAPDNAEILYHYGAAKIAAGDIDSGKEVLEQALTKGGANFEFAAETQSLLDQ